MNEQTKLFINSHLNDDVRKLALSKIPDGVNLRFALQQIDGRQRAKHKLPSLVSNPDIIFPVHLSVEQCSSETTAEYKASVLKRVIKERTDKASSPFCTELMADLTSGFGIDFIAISKLFRKAVYVERNTDLCAIAEQNFHTLNLTNIQIVNEEAENFLSHIGDYFQEANPSVQENKKNSAFFFIDPARRSESGARTYAISDCTPDILTLIPQLKQHGNALFLKLSPMLDWHKAVEDIQTCGVNVSEVHIVSVKNECKELLLLIELQNSPEPTLRLFCVNDESVIEVTKQSAEENAAKENAKENAPSQQNSPFTTQLPTSENNSQVLLIPNASIMKAGCWDFLTSRFDVTPADANSHIFFSSHEIVDFPGKQYTIQAICSLNKKELRNAIQGITHANIAVRNFPLSADALRKRLKLKDGGSTYIFGTTIKGEHKLIITKN